MKLKSTITGALAAVLVLSTVLPTAAFAECTIAYQAEISRLRDTDEYFRPWGIDKGGGWALGVTLVAPLGVTAVLTSIDSVKASDREKVIQLIRAAKAGNGLMLARIASELGTVIERVAETVNQIDAVDAFCLDGKVLSYGEAVELVRLTLESSK